jgi:hypothetical protein
MPKLSLSAVVAGFVMVSALLIKFNQDTVVPDGLSAFRLGGLLGLLLVILPWIQKGDILAFIFGYILIAILLFNAFILFSVNSFTRWVPRFS